MNEDTVNKIFDVLVNNGAVEGIEEKRQEFLLYLTIHKTHEYRFQGNLGFGGKFYCNHFRWRIDCYQEEYTPEKKEIINKTNKELEELKRCLT